MSSHSMDDFNDHLEVKLEHVGFRELLQLLLSEDIHKRSFVHIEGEKKLQFSFPHRWILFYSLVAQKVLSLLKNPMAFLKKAICFFLNLPSSNGGLLGLLANTVAGNVVKPDPLSSTFRSLIGHLDTRFNLDPRVVAGGPSYNAALSLSIMASRLSYENDAFIKTVVEDRWQMKLLDGPHSFRNDFQEERSTQAFMFKDRNDDPNLILVAFRGTDPFNMDAWCSDLDITWCMIKDVGKIHGGFMKALGLPKPRGEGTYPYLWPKDLKDDQGLAYYTIRKRLTTELHKYKNAKFILTGHSLGGALAILMAAGLMLHDEKELLQRLKGVYTFGQPRVGDHQFGNFMKVKMKYYDVTKRYHRYVYCNDVVPRLPSDDDTFLFKHFGPCIYYNSLYKGKVIHESPNKNYFSWGLWFIPKHLNAMWELVRGIILPFMEGPDYRESCVLTLFRLIGLITPGLADHGPQDYHNITHLGVLSSDLTDHKNDLFDPSDEIVRFSQVHPKSE